MARSRAELPIPQAGDLYTEALAAAVLDMIADGKTIRQIEGADGMPSWPTIRRWLRTVPGFATQYARAREISADALESDVLEQARKANDRDSAAAARAKLDAVKWATAIRNPRVYGAKVDINHTGQVTVLTPEQRLARIRELSAKMSGAVLEGAVRDGVAEVV